MNSSTETTSKQVSSKTIAQNSNRIDPTCDVEPADVSKQNAAVVQTGSSSMNNPSKGNSNTVSQNSKSANQGQNVNQPPQTDHFPYDSPAIREETVNKYNNATKDSNVPDDQFIASEETSLINKPGKKSCRDSTRMFCDDATGLYLLFHFYFIQGLILNLFMDLIPLQLLYNGIDEKQYSLFKWVALPYSTKFIFSPILDAYYSEKYGKRKLYIITGFYISSALLLISGFFIENLIAQTAIYEIFFISLITIAFTAIVDIATDGLSVTLIKHEENLKFIPLCQGLGIGFGGIISFNLYIYLSSDQFCQDVLGLQGAILSESIFSWFVACLIFLTALFTHIFFHEIHEQVQKPNFKASMAKLQWFFRNFNLLKLSMILLFMNYSFNSMLSASWYVLFTYHGFSKEVLSTITLLNMPIAFTGACINSIIIKPGRELTYALRVYWLFYASSLFLLCIALLYPLPTEDEFDQRQNPEKMNFLSDPLYQMALIQIIIDGIISNFISMAIMSFILRVSDIQFSAIYLTTAYSLWNFGNLWPRSISPLLLHGTELGFIAGTSTTYAIVFFALGADLFNEIEPLSKVEMHLGPVESNNSTIEDQESQQNQTIGPDPVSVVRTDSPETSKEGVQQSSNTVNDSSKITK